MRAAAKPRPASVFQKDFVDAKHVRFPDLKARKIAKGWPQLRDLIETHGFPPGFYLTPQQRCWWEDEVETWLEARLPLFYPGVKPPLRGGAP